MQRIEAEFEIVTPMFLGGADPKATAELRASSIKGALRFWWRALAWSRTTGSEKDRLEKLRTWEDEIFGSAHSGQGLLLLSVSMGIKAQRSDTLNLQNFLGGYDKSSCQRNYRDNWRRGGGIAYLAGQGLTDRTPEAGFFDSRPSQPPNQKFCVSLCCRSINRCAQFTFDTRLDGVAPSIGEALEVFAFVGGLGARSRRGFGSIRIVSIEGDTNIATPVTRQEYTSRFSQILESARSGQNDADTSFIPYSAFSQFSGAILHVADAGWTAGQLHAEVGHVFQLYRSAGFEQRGVHKVNGVTARKLFPDDETWMWDVIRHPAGSTTQPTYSNLSVPLRTVFGLPHAYGSRSAPRGTRVSVNSSEEGRRASPLILHLHTFENDPPVALWLALPARFVSDQKDHVARLQVFDRHKPDRYEVSKSGPWPEDYRVDYGPIHRFLRDDDRLIGTNRVEIQLGDPA